jgi:hypothetical protein
MEEAISMREFFLRGQGISAGQQGSRNFQAGGSILVRGWDGKSAHGLDESFAWNGTTYRSLTGLA